MRGFSPDIVIRCKNSDDRDHFVIIENKIITGACLQCNQMENYQKLAKMLCEEKISFDLIFLQSVGLGNKIYDQAEIFQENANLGQNFGIIFWEEVFEKMYASGFAPTGLPIEVWKQYTPAYHVECGVPQAAKVQRLPPV